MRPFRDLLLQFPVLCLLASPSVKFAQGVEVVGTSSSTSSLALPDRRQADITPRGLQMGDFGCASAPIDDSEQRLGSGKLCYTNSDCESNACNLLFMCKQCLGAFGSYCYDNYDCASNICSTSDEACLDASGTGAFGYSCTDNNQCVSDFCSPSEGCLRQIGKECYDDIECGTDFCHPALESCEYSPDEIITMDWDDLVEDDNHHAFYDFGYTKEKWDAYEDVFIFEQPYSALSELEKQYASSLGYTEDSWNNKVLRSQAKPGFEIHSTGNVTATAISGTSIRLIAPYNASDRDHETWVLSSDCITPFDGIPEDAFTVETTSAVPLGPAHITFNSTIDVDISKVNTTSYWKALPGGALGGVFGLCIETFIYFELSDGFNEKMNFVNTNLTLTVEMDANFQVTSATSRDAAKQEEVRVDYSDYVTAYECVESDLVNKANGQEYSQGDELKICVKSKDPTIVQVGGIQRLTLSQDDDTTDDDFTYINGGNPVSSEIAATTCDKTITPAHVCHADMQLLGRYFEDESPGELTATGSVKLSFPDGSARRLTVDVPIASGIRGGDLALENSARHMEEEKPDDSPFDVTVSLKSLVESGSDYYGVSLVSGLVAAAGGAILMV